MWKSCSEQEELEWRREESRRRGRSSRRDQLGGVERQEAVLRRVGGDEEQEAGRRGETWAESRTGDSMKHTHSPQFSQRRDLSVFYSTRSSWEGAMPNPTSSPESGALTGSDPSRGPPAWAGPRLDAGAARPPYSMTRCTCLVLGRRRCTVMGDETRGQARQKAPWIVTLW